MPPIHLSKKIQNIIGILISIGVISAFLIRPNHYSVIGKTQQQVKIKSVFKVIKVIDGDSIIIDNGRQVRYIGINAPELRDDNNIKQCYSIESYLKNRQLVLNRYVYLEKDITDSDKYARLLRYVYLYDIKKRQIGKMINKFLIQNGYVKLATYPPDTKYYKIFKQEQIKAANKNMGLWSTCNSKSSKTIK